MAADRCVTGLPVTGAIRRQADDGSVDLIRKGLKLADVARLLTGECPGDDIATAGIRGNMQFAPLPAGFHAVFLFRSLTGFMDVQADAVNDTMQGLRGAVIRVIVTFSGDLQLAAASARGCMIGHRRIDTRQLKQGGDKAFNLA